MTKLLNIGVVANTAFNIYNFRLGLIKALKQEGHHVIAIAPADDYVDLLKENDVEFIEVKNLARKGTNPVSDLILVNELRKIYTKKKFDVIFQYTIKPNIYGTIAARLSNTKSICTVTGLGYTFLNKSISSLIAHRLYRLAFSFAERVLFQNSDDQQVFLDARLVDKDKTIIVPGSGVDTEHFHPEFCKGITDNRHCDPLIDGEAISRNETDVSIPQRGIIRFLMIGRLLKDKGVYEYVEAAKHILVQNKNVEFHLLGDIDNNNPSAIKQQDLESWIRNGIIQYHRHTKDIRPFICKADCIILPSYREGMPRVILESMAMEKLCITTDAPGCKDAIIDNESGFICKKADVVSLEEKMKYFITLEDKYKYIICVNARERAVNVFSVDNINLIYLNLLRNLDYD